MLGLEPLPEPEGAVVHSDVDSGEESSYAMETPGTDVSDTRLRVHLDYASERFCTDVSDTRRRLRKGKGRRDNRRRRREGLSPGGGGGGGRARSLYATLPSPPPPPPPRVLKDSGAGAMAPTASKFLSHASLKGVLCL